MTHRDENNIIIESAIRFSRGKRINKFSRVGVLGVRGWLIVEDKEPGKINIKIDGESIWLNVNMACRLDILQKRIKTLCQK